MPNASPNLLMIARIGFAARGLLYLIIGYLALELGRSEDTGGAMEWLQGKTGGMVLGALAVGFTGYGIWRVIDAVLDTQAKGNDAKGIVGRIAGGLSGLIHLGLAYSAVRLATGSDKSAGSSSDSAESGAATAMTLPFGEALLFVAAAILAAASVTQFVKAAKRSFCENLSSEAKNRWWVIAAGVGGYAARGMVFMVAAWLAFRAGQQHDPAEAGALADALRTMPGALRTAVAAGLCLFGVYSLIEARFRILPDPQVKRRVSQALS